MFIRSFVLVLVLAFSFAIVNGQAPDGQKPSAATPRLRDLPFPAGVDLQFLIKELARDLDLNVLFDSESFRSPRKTFIELRNVTSATALEYIRLQDDLYFEEVGPNTIIVASRFKGTSIHQIGVGVTPMTEQLANYFGVEGGVLINTVRSNSPASKAGLNAGDVIVEIDGVSIKGAFGVVRAINDKKDSDVVLTIVRDRKSKVITVTPEKSSLGSIVQK
jgi:membrane-associated protease RseP (regulator of RpoE activity)